MQCGALKSNENNSKWRDIKRNTYKIIEKNDEIIKKPSNLQFYVDKIGKKWYNYIVLIDKRETRDIFKTH